MAIQENKIRLDHFLKCQPNQRLLVENMDVLMSRKTLITNMEKAHLKGEDRDNVIASLQTLSATEDLSVFDTNNLDGTQLYVSLYEFLTAHSTDTELVWCVVKVLSVAVQNPRAHTALLNTYHFIPLLTNLLDTHLTTDRKTIVLNIIQELSFGVLASWHEPHLPKLISLLVDLVMDEDNELTPLALSVLVNLLHNNKPTIYILMGCVDIKKLIRKVVNLRRDSVDISFQVCKLLMVLDHLSGNVPDAEILTFVQVSFVRLKKALMCGDTLLMRHVVHFFRDANESKHARKILLTYPRYEEEINKLLIALKSKEENDWQCVQQLVDFLQQLVDLELPAVTSLFTSLANSLLEWLQVESVIPRVLQLYSVMLRQSRNNNDQEYKNICSCLETHLQRLIEMFHAKCKQGCSKSNNKELLVGLLHLFHELNGNPTFCGFIAANVDKELVKNLLLPVISINDTEQSQLFHHPVTELCVEVLSFVSQLSLDDKEWLFLYSELLQKKQILKILAVSLCSGTFEMKKQILYLAGTTSFSSECLAGLAKYLTDLNQFLISAPASQHLSYEKTSPGPKLQVDLAPPFGKHQSESLNSLIMKLEDLCSKNQLQNSSLSGIIELYNYKLAEMRRAERLQQSSMEAADKHRAQLSQRVAQLSAETDRLHQLLYSRQLSTESVEAEVAVLREQLQTAQDSATASHIKFKQLKQDATSKSMIIKEQSEEIANMKRIIEGHEKKQEALDQTIEELKQTIKLLEAEKSDLQTESTKLQEKLKTTEETLLEKETLLGKKSTLVQTLQQEISKQLTQIKGLEKTIKEKDKELQDLERTRKLIFEISGGKKNNL